MHYFDIKFLIVVTLLALILVSYSLLRKKIGQEWIVAILCALFITSYTEYIYTESNLFIGTLNIFPLISWTAGLMVLREIYEQVTAKYKFVFVSIVYVVAILLVEYIGYYLLGIERVGNYPSLLGLGVIHGQFVTHAFYLFAGPIYLLVTDYLKVK